MKRKLSSLNIGDKFLTTVGQQRRLPFTIENLRTQYAVHQIVEKSPSKIVSVTADQAKHDFILNAYGDIADWRVAETIKMTDPFPQADDDMIIAYAAPVLEHKSGKHEVAIYVSRVGEFVATGQIVQSPERKASFRTFGFEEITEKPLYKTGNAVFLEEDIKFDATGLGWREGDLICASDFRCKMNNDVLYMKLENPIKVGNFKTKEEVGKFWPAPEQSAFLPDYESILYFSEEKGRAIAALEPDMALILVTKSRSGRSLGHVIVGGMGQLLYSWDDADCYFEAIQSEGLWLATNLKGWSNRSYEGEYDCGIDFDFEPATIKDLEKFGHDEASMTEEIRAITERDGLDQTATAYIEKAVIASKSEAHSARNDDLVACP